jgi:hypothetical protein
MVKRLLEYNRSRIGYHGGLRKNHHLIKGVEMLERVDDRKEFPRSDPPESELLREKVGTGHPYFNS